MTDQIDDGGLAFPDPARAGGHCMEAGMYLRDWFASAALPTVVGLIGLPEEGPDDVWNQAIAAQAYALADAMLAARKVRHD